MLVELEVNSVHIARDDDLGSVKKSYSRFLCNSPVKLPECDRLLLSPTEKLREVRLTHRS